MQIVYSTGTPHHREMKIDEYNLVPFFLSQGYLPLPTLSHITLLHLPPLSLPDFPWSKLLAIVTSHANMIPVQKRRYIVT